MKIRNDYVSNSSSSSFILIGEKLENKKVTIEDLADNEEYAYFIILPGAGGTGDYIIKVTPEIIMDCDLYQVDMNRKRKVSVIKAKYVMTDGCWMKRARDVDFMFRIDEYTSFHERPYEQEMNRNMQTDGVGIDGMRIFKYEKDYENPKYYNEAIRTLKSYCRVRSRKKDK